jgi:hypothetical protein
MERFTAIRDRLQPSSVGHGPTDATASPSLPSSRHRRRALELILYGKIDRMELYLETSLIFRSTIMYDKFRTKLRNVLTIPHDFFFKIH